MLDGSYSVLVIQDYTKYIIKKHETLTTIPPVYIYINRINNRLLFILKDEYKLELQTPEKMKLFDSTKNYGENVPSLESVEVLLVQCNLVDNQYQQKAELLYTFTHKKSFAYLLNVEPNNSVFLKN